ncbi:hypothetical protein FUAX_41090 (plasmid) [Fulvitalea axinellae]|uniref:AAA+ ATPase domain-containing protein n=1 Tax=Fulvitalea axinellae TaxID=1182444 RepID=A0AAU9D1Z8_9BACT|nr:hypothetical protein FUAX_41090 [Fulvitalea axinellae]
MGINKEQVVAKLRLKVEKYGSQNKAAKSMKGVSPAMVNMMVSGKWDGIGEGMWRKVAAHVGWTAEGWQAVKTGDFKVLGTLLEKARTESLVFAVTGEAGTGKSFATRLYASEHKRAYLLQCNEFWNRKYFLMEALGAMGRDSSGLTVSDMMVELVRALKKEENPLIIMDEADKLSDQVLYFFITLYNQLEDHCGIVLLATDHLSKRIRKGLKLNKKGYKEIYSRVNRKFIELKGVGISDVTQVCMANGVDDRDVIREIFNDCEGDLRRVKQKVRAYRQGA